MAARIAEALENADQLPELGRNGRLCVQERFGFSAQAELYRDLFDQLCPETFEDEGDLPEETEQASEQDGKPATMPAISLDDDLLATESTCNS
jgi:hypothetical protein